MVRGKLPDVRVGLSLHSPVYVVFSKWRSRLQCMEVSCLVSERECAGEHLAGHAWTAQHHAATVASLFSASHPSSIHQDNVDTPVEKLHNLYSSGLYDGN
jgi:hypothetical protein